MTFIVRDGRPDDAAAIARLCAEFAQYLAALGEPEPRSISTEEVLRDGFGEQPAFASIVAEYDGRVVGYLLHHPGYDIVRGGRISIIVDLFVTAEARRAGVGRALMEHARHACRRSGKHALVWAVHSRNLAAIAFYKRLGATFSEDLLVIWPAG